jgi:hypothetical protein
MTVPSDEWWLNSTCTLTPVYMQWNGRITRTKRDISIYAWYPWACHGERLKVCVNVYRGTCLKYVSHICGMLKEVPLTKHSVIQPFVNGRTSKIILHIASNPDMWKRKQNKKAVCTVRRLFQLCQLRNQISHDISRDIWKFCTVL